MNPTSKPLVELIDTLDGAEKEAQDPVIATDPTSTPSGRGRGKSDLPVPPRPQSKSTIHIEGRTTPITRAIVTTSPPVGSGGKAASSFMMPTTAPSLQKRPANTGSAEPKSPRAELRERSASSPIRPASPEKSPKPDISRLNLSGMATSDGLSAPSSPRSRRRRRS